MKGSHSLKAHDFRFSFTPLKRVLFTFPSRYWYAIGHQLVFSLGRWAPQIQTGFHVSRPTWDTLSRFLAFGQGAVTRCGRPFQTVTLAVRP